MVKLEIKGVTKSFYRNDGKQSTIINAIENINLAVNDGEFVCLTGPSGCGKSTLLNILAGLDNPTKGQVVLNGRPITGTGPDRIMVFQENALFPWMKVIDNVEFGLKIAKVEKIKRREIAMQYLDMMQLKNFQKRMYISFLEV